MFLPWLTHPVLFKVFSFPMVLKKLRALTAVSTGTPMVGAALEADDDETTAAGEMMSPVAFIDILKVLILITAAGYSDRSSRSKSKVSLFNMFVR